MTYSDDPRDLVELAVSIGTRAAELARFERGDGIEVAYSKTALTDIVTEGDRKTEQFIRESVALARPNDGFVGEEFDPKPSASGLTWVVDPIDGTVNYLYGLAPCAVSIAVVRGDVLTGEWEPLAGAVVSIFGGDVYRAVAGQGAFLNGRRVSVSDKVELPTAMVCTSFAYDPQVRDRQARVVRRLITEVRDIRRVGCASIELCSLAAGKVDFFYDRGLKPWDYAAGTLVAREAGAVVRGRRGASQPGEPLTVASNPVLIDMLQPMIESWLEEEGL